jgi:hypothetical protein
MGLLTLSQVQNSRVAEISGAVPTSSDFTSLVNEATDQLVRRGNWWGTVQPMMGCCYDGCITWPRRVASVLAINTRCGRYSMPANRWFQFMDWSRTDHSGLYQNWRSRGRAMVTDFDGSLPVFNPIPCGQPRHVRYYVDSVTDVGETIVVYGKDINGQRLWGERPDGTIQDGLLLTLQLPYVQTPTPLLSVDRIFKNITNARVRAYQVDGSGVQYDMAVYEPSEQSPDYIRSRVGRCEAGMITALVRLAFIPVQFPDDLVIIENIGALRDMVYSIKKKEAGELPAAAQLEKSAIRELNYEMRQRYPDEQFIVRFSPFGNDDLNNARTRISMI